MDARFISPRTLALITTHQCTAACDHCCFACTPRVTKRIPPQRLAELIDEAVEIPSLREIGFTGGECFLLGKELVERIAQVKALGKRAVCVTNGYWAVNRKAAQRVVDDVASAGLARMTISTGEMHSVYVPLERVINGAIAACDAGIDIEISLEDFRKTTFDWRAVCEHPEILRREKRSNFWIAARRWIPNAEGKGQADVRHHARYDRFRHRRPSRCTTVMDVLAVNPSLKLVACCGYPLESLEDLHLGSVADKTITQVLADAPTDPLKLWLHAMGPERMLLFAKRYLPDYPLPQSPQICLTCVHLFRDPEVLRVLREHFHEVEEEVTSGYLRYRRRDLAS